MVKKLTVTLFGLSTLVLAGCGTGEPVGQQPPPPAVEVVQVSAEPTTLWRSFTGRVVAPETVELRPRVSGYIDQVSFAEGALVKRGDILFTIDQRPYKARLRAAEADLQRVRSQLSFSEKQAGRAQQLLDSKAISREEYDRRIASRDAERAALSAAEAAVQNAQLDFQYTQVKAPISGQVSRALVTKGNLANADTTLLTTLVSVDPMYVYFESDEQTFAESRRLLSADATPPVHIGLAGENGYPHKGKLDFIDNRLNSHTGTIQFRAVVANPNGAFKPGQFARVEMPIEEVDQAVLIDSKAVLTDQDRRYVYVVNQENLTERRPVQVGPRQGQRTVIRGGLQTGERIVVNGLQKIFFPGMPVVPEMVAKQGQGGSAQAAGH
ncbi:efflux RND transporter periplasmic adaptor subunit [Microbulbifer sp. GL-2]|uniref:efflux RND transporter periplasmic adaptor subunit n=1 Tax=Microbulbifer sp. GL-2 TaxID=2591606 RepID=UPI0011639586|nr:efflux RND transporter periplasmic adaptor subunit [Microbulbifer sp. GL-2]BBM00543.1 MexE family multidrug efflux RND transporter periplasmic adaptor subunit [Microbulbifer sp. GL-2]